MFEDSLSEDLKSFSNTEPKNVRYKVLNHINDVLHSMGHDINEYNLVLENIRPSETTKDTKDIHFERNIIVSEEDLLLPKNLNAEQLISYNTIIDRISSKKAGAFFVDGPGGTGKTYLYRALLATVRSQGFIALATATSGVAASVLPGGRTAHSRFKMPIDIDDNFCCNVSKQSPLACLIKDAKLIVWDEASMAKKNMIEALDVLLRDIMDVKTLFGGKVIVFGGDFRQTLPVKFNMFWSKSHSLAPPPDSPSRIEEFSTLRGIVNLFYSAEADSSRNSDPRQAFQQSTSTGLLYINQQLKQLKLRRRQARGTFVLSTLQSYCTAKAIEERGYIFHLRNLTTSPHIDSDIADCLNLSIDNAYLVENPGALDNAKLLAIYTADNFSSPEDHCQPSSAPHLIQLSYIFAPQMLVLGPGNAWPAFTMDGQWRILETEVSNMDAKDTLQ
ncbi:hypothetical protein KY285_017959 [Solanum tuberosum]|nr:hypothetical protein KY285_017959 [Solanum tuberosum]